MVLKFCTFVLFATTSVQANSFSDLNPEQQAKIRYGELVTIPVSVQGDLFRGTFFQYLKGISPIQPASVWVDYNNQFKFVPGMTYTRVLKWHGKKALVTHHINGAVFLSPELQRATPTAISEAFAYTYDLDEEVFLDSGSYTIRWNIPKNKRTLGSDEQGWIEFSPFEEGSLITYENATTPPLFEIFKYLPFILDEMALVPQQYYHDTLTYLIERLNHVIQSGEIEAEMINLNEVLARSPTSLSEKPPAPPEAQ